MSNNGNKENKENKENKSLPRIAVIITCHNYADMVEEAIQSVLDQDYPHNLLTIVCINDGSTDTSRGVIEGLIQDGKYTNQTDQIFFGHVGDIKAYLINNSTPRKQAYARNQGIRLVWNENDLFCILDADDKYVCNKISRSVEEWLKDPEIIGAVYSDLLIHNLQTGVIIEELRQSYDHSTLQHSCVTSNAPLLSKKALAECGLYDIEISPTEDYDIMLRISSKYLLLHIPQCLSIYRVTGRNSTITTNRERIIETHRLMRAKLKNEIPYKFE